MNKYDNNLMLFVSGNENDVLTDFKRILKNTILDINSDYKLHKVNINVELLNDPSNLIDARITLFFDKIPIQYFDVWLSSYIKLTYNDLIKLNEIAEGILKYESFNNGLKDTNGLEAIIGGVDNSFYGTDVCPTIIDKAVYFWYKIAQKQLFHNGNKRTALLSAIFLLTTNGYNFKGYSLKKLDGDGVKDLYNISLKIANHEMTKDELKEYILNNLTIDFKYQDDIMNSIINSVKGKEDDK
ncbi:type II toxin-antitoxin system death-on-curing family toxin [Apilactobacillus sp. EABW-1NA]|uniref:type II toxin-antitoxin system death-on-curing family toxin n=1 Tax=Apilactobacillus sp. EABW-1NA TaxID=2984137 RepID=UPI0025B19805|nr:type II toxin-antitoxin system death-on-curing family toxin [Apilactobacillus sp. EABW-1NA]MDN2612701.1 type II toxin-antitoxin system death-on-curing family toxin [Apilactobacillus sp. EABW-1NA]